MDKRLTLILLLALIARIALLASAGGRPSRLFTPDSHDYVTLARSLTDEHAFRRDGRPEIFRTPGYPVFLAGMRYLSRLTGSAVEPWRLAIYVQIALDVLLVALTFELAELLLGRRVGLVAGALQAICPVAVVASCRVLSDGLFALLLTTAVWLTVRHLRSGGWRELLVAAVALAAACYVRPVGLAFAAVFVVVLLTRPKRWRRGGAMAGILAALIVPWIVRNAHVAGYVGFSSFATDSMYKYSAPFVLTRERGVSAEHARLDPIEPADPETGRQRTPGEMARLRADAALDAIASHPWTYAQIHLRGSMGFWLPGAPDVLQIAGLTRGERGTLGVMREEGPWAAARHYFADNAAAVVLVVPLVGLLIARYAAAAVCAVRQLGQGVSAAGWLGVALLVLAALLPGPAAHPRFRVPVAPLLSIAAACGAIVLRDWVRRER